MGRNGSLRQLEFRADPRREAPGSLAKFGPLFDDFVAGLHALYERYTNQELEVVLRFTADATEVQKRATERLNGKD